MCPFDHPFFVLISWIQLNSSCISSNYEQILAVFQTILLMVLALWECGTQKRHQLIKLVYIAFRYIIVLTDVLIADELIQHSVFLAYYLDYSLFYCLSYSYNYY